MSNKDAQLFLHIYSWYLQIDKKIYKKIILFEKHLSCFNKVFLR